MDKLSGMIGILLSFASVSAQHNTTTTAIHDPNRVHPSLGVVLAVLSIMFCTTLLIVAYAKFCSSQTPEFRSNEIQNPGLIVGSWSRFSGIDRTVVESLPFFTFSSLKGSRQGLECVVCLSRFEDSEILRLLPKCHHAFHTSCIDKWFENHSSCPLCRHKLDVEDVKYLAYTNSFRNHQHIIDDNPQNQQNLEFYVEREESRESSSRFMNNMARFGRGKSEMHRFQHKIIISDVIQKSRWSEVNSSDIMSLSSEMLSVISSQRLCRSRSNSQRFISDEISSNDHIVKIKNDMETKRLLKSKSSMAHGIEQEDQSSTSFCDDELELDRCARPRLIDSSEKRSMSEITKFPRFEGLDLRNFDKNEKIKRLWLPMARRTIQRFSSQEKCLLEVSQHDSSHV